MADMPTVGKHRPAGERRLIEERGLKPEQEGHLFVNRFGRPLSRSGIAEIVDRHASKAATKTSGLRGKKVTPHTLRHTTAMHLLQSGVEVNVIRTWLGHSCGRLASWWNLCTQNRCGPCRPEIPFPYP